jgi:hypothetical protein
MAASADWYKVIVEGIAGGSVPADSGTRRARSHCRFNALMLQLR